MRFAYPPYNTCVLSFWPVGRISEAHPPTYLRTFLLSCRVDKRSASTEKTTVILPKKPMSFCAQSQNLLGSLENIFCLLFRRFCNSASLRAEWHRYFFAPCRMTNDIKCHSCESRNPDEICRVDKRSASTILFAYFFLRSTSPEMELINQDLFYRSHAPAWECIADSPLPTHL